MKSGISDEGPCAFWFRFLHHSNLQRPPPVLGHCTVQLWLAAAPAHQQQQSRRLLSSELTVSALDILLSRQQRQSQAPTPTSGGLHDSSSLHPPILTTPVTPILRKHQSAVSRIRLENGRNHSEPACECHHLTRAEGELAVPRCEPLFGSRRCARTTPRSFRLYAVYQHRLDSLDAI